jgi:putative ABC transport system permease protein
LSASQPIGGFNSSGPVIIENQPEPPPGHYPEVFFEPVSLGYFDTFGIRLRAGRSFNASDRLDGPRVVIVNETMARRFWPNDSPIGKRFRFPGNNRNWLEVVGVVNDVGFPGTLSEPYTRLEAFRPFAQQPPLGINITLRTVTPPETLTDSLRRIVADVMPLSPVSRIRTAQALVDQSLGRISLLATLLGAFAALGVGLAAIGVYGVTSYSVVQRTSELGIRIALGAQAADVLRLVLTRGVLLILVGISIGLAGAIGVGRVLMSAIPTLPTRDPVALAAFTLALVLVALLACYVPARRATKVNPLVALRHE